MPFKGSDFQATCWKPVPDAVGFCRGYVQAVLDGIPEGEICLPEGTTRSALVGLVMDEMKEDPKLLPVNASSAIVIVLRKHFSCR